jgi:hypothetical protein
MSTLAEIESAVDSLPRPEQVTLLEYLKRRLADATSVSAASDSDPQQRRRWLADRRESEFIRLSEEWKRDTGFHSSLSKKFMHPAYQTIMAMGKEALPFILRELEKSPGHWFYALRFIVQRDVAENADSFEEARQIWLEWGRRNHLI